MQIKIAIVPTWDTVQAVLEKSSEFLSGVDSDTDFIAATSMCVSELIENAVKYGAKTPDQGDIEFDMSLDEHGVRVRIAHGIKSERDLGNVREIIDRIRETDDHAGLYVGRLRELIENPVPGASQLGLYRIAYEGHFDLNYDYTDGVFTITADRPLT